MKGARNRARTVAAAAAAVCMVLVLAVPRAEAGDRSRHRWQGIAIGVASTILLDHLMRPGLATVEYGPAPGPAYGGGPRAWERPRRGYGPRPGPCSGRWERVWIPGHYDGFGKFIEGHYESYWVDGPRYRAARFSPRW